MADGRPRGGGQLGERTGRPPRSRVEKLDRALGAGACWRMSKGMDRELRMQALCRGIRSAYARSTMARRCIGEHRRGMQSSYCKRMLSRINAPRWRGTRVWTGSRSISTGASVTSTATSSAASSSTSAGASTAASTTRARRVRTRTACGPTCSRPHGGCGYSNIRYPGGNFVSAYRWRDGVGPSRGPARSGPTRPGTRPSPTRSARTSSSASAARSAPSPYFVVNCGRRRHARGARLGRVLQRHARRPR